MSFVAVAIGGAAVIGAGASMYAANKQSGAAGEAGRLTMADAERTRSTLNPWVTTGVSANSELSNRLGIGSGVSIDDPAYKDIYNKMVANFDAAHQQRYGMSIYDPRADAASRDQALERLKQQAMDQVSQTQAKPANFGSLTTPFTMGDLTDEPGYQFGLSEGEKGIDRAAAAGSGRYSGATLKALTRFNEDYAGTKYDAAFARDKSTKDQTYNFLMGESNLGENAAAQTGAIGANATRSAADLITGGANAEAAGAIGATNAITGGVNTGLNYYQQQQLLKTLGTNRGTGTAPYTMGGNI